jgi:hypothetical protein
MENIYIMHNKFMKRITSSIATIGVSLTLAHAQSETSAIGPYTLSVINEGEFGMEDYKYKMTISDGSKNLFTKESESSITGYEILPGSIEYDNGVLSFVYIKLQDGLDPCEISLVRINDGKTEEATLSYDIQDHKKIVSPKSIPSNWDVTKTRKYIQGIVNELEGVDMETTQRQTISQENIDKGEKKELKEEDKNKSPDNEHGIEW